MKYLILHPADGSLNDDCVISVKFKIVAKVEAKDLQDAFVKAQNDFNDDYAKNKVRSTSVGDIIMCLEDQTTHIVMPTGFKNIDSLNEVHNERDLNPLI